MNNITSNTTRRRIVAVAQTCPVSGDVDANLDEHVALAEIAGSRGAQVMVFPELSLTGYEMGMAGDLAFSEEDRRLSRLLEVAETCSIILIAGAPVRIGARLHIGAFIVYADRTVSLYTKHRLGAFPAAASCDGIVPPSEATAFDPGDRNPLVNLGDHLAAVAVCADTGLTSHPQLAVERGAETYLASMFVIPSEFESEVAKLSGYAAKHAMPVGLANYGSSTGGLASAGRSTLWSERGEILVQLGKTGSGVAIAKETPGGWSSEAIRL